jgi:ribose transport system permease protein
MINGKVRRTIPLITCFSMAIFNRGGTSFTGGVGRIETTLIGAMIMTMITNGLNILGVSSFWQQVFVGSIIIFAVWLDSLKVRK